MRLRHHLRALRRVAARDHDLEALLRQRPRRRQPDAARTAGGSLRGDLAELITRARSTLFAPGMVTLLRMTKAPPLSRRACAEEQARHPNALAMPRVDRGAAPRSRARVSMLFARLVFRGERLDDAFVDAVLDSFVTAVPKQLSRPSGCLSVATSMTWRPT